MSSDPAARPWRTFLFADPAAHSLSPGMHRAAFAHAGLSGTYEARRVTAAELPGAVADLRFPGVLGANLSLPHKESVLPLLDSLTPAARAIGAVNTVLVREGRLTGENTDAPGLLAALAEAGAPAHGPAVVLGAGGAARAAVWALHTQALHNRVLGGQGRAVLVVNRTPEKARALTAELGGTPMQAADVPWGDVRLVVNASSAGLNAPEASPLLAFPQALRHSGAFVYDMVYTPAETRLLRDARAAGLRAENGLGMLAHQARLAFLAWTGVAVPAQVFRAALPNPGGAAT